MDKKALRTRKGKSRTTRPYRPNQQSIFGKVASKVKNLLNPSWLFNVSQWIGTSGEEEQQPGCSTDLMDEDSSRDDDDFTPQPTHGSKRPRLQLHEPSPSILHSATQTWLDTPSVSHSLNNPLSHMSPAGHSSIIDSKEAPSALNGDDHSENSEGSASTSGCSSLVSSHKDRSRHFPSSSITLREPYDSLQGLKESIRLKNRQDVASQKEGDNSFNRSLWSSSLNSPGSIQRRPSVAHRNQPSFNISTFSGPSKLNESDRRMSSPFYEGKTTFGGASSVRRMPVSVAPYQVQKSFSQSIKTKSDMIKNKSEDSLEGLSSAARRILMTLEQMSSPVTDAKKVPNTNTSPVDLSIYLTPPKHRRNSVFTPSVATKGPPIANISTITKLSALKNYSGLKMVKRLNNSSVESANTAENRNNSVIDISEPENKSTLDYSELLMHMENAQKSGGGKMKVKRNLHHVSKEPELNVMPSLRSIPLPISKLPTISFGTKAENSEVPKQSCGAFTFSSPIEHTPPVSAVSKTHVSPFDKPNQAVNESTGSFVFSNPIEHPIELPSTNLSVKESSNSLMNNASETPKWVCKDCWVRNPSHESRCLACGSLPAEQSSTDTAAATGYQFTSSVQTPGSNEFDSKSVPSSTGNTFTFGISTSNSSILSSSVPLPTKSNSPSKHPESFEGINSQFIPSSNAKASETINVDGSLNTKKEVNPSPMPPSLLKGVFCHSNGARLHSSDKERTTNDTSSVSEANKAPVLQVQSSNFTLPSEKPKKTVDALPEKEKNSNTFAKANSTETSVPSVFKAFSVKKPGEWECDTCLVRNPPEKSKCIACETLHSAKEKNSVMKDPENFKFNSPQNSSPINFKFGSFSSTSTSTTTSTTSTGFKLSVPASSSVATGFQFGSSVQTSSSTGTPAFKFGAVTTSENAFSLPVPTSTISVPKSDNLVGQTASFGGVALATTKNETFISSDVKSVEPKTETNETKLLTNFSDNKRKSVSSSSGETDAVTTEMNKADKTTIPLTNSNLTFPLVPSEKSNTSDNFSFAPKKEKSEASPFSQIAAAEAPAANSVSSAFKILSGIKPGEWQCDSCFVRNSSDKLKCIACEAVKKENNSVATGFQFGSSVQTSSSTATPAFKFGAVATSENAFSLPVPTSTIAVSKSDNLVGQAASFGGVALAPTKNETFISSDVKSVEPKTETKLLTNFSDNKRKSFSSSGETDAVTTEMNKADKTNIPLTNSNLTFPLVPSEKSNTSDNFSFASKKEKNEASPFSQIAAAEAPAANSVSSAFKIFSGIKPGEWQCDSCFVRNSSDKLKCIACEAVKKEKNSGVKEEGFKLNCPQSNAPITFKFGAFTPVSQVSTTASTATTAAPTTSFKINNPATTTSGFTFKGISNEKPSSVPSNSISFNAPTSSSAPSVFKFGSSVPASTGGFVFGASKSEPQSTAPTPFVFGTASNTSSSAFSGFQAAQPPVNHTFQFGAQPTGSSTGATPFGVTNSPFAFGNKTENTNQAATTQASVPAFGAQTLQPIVFGAQSVPPFGRPERPSGGFNFGTAPTNPPVFRFGGKDKKPGTPLPGFSFGTPTQVETANNFQGGFSMNTTPSFNFGASSTPIVPFQFAASGTEGGSSQSSAPRKYRKAARRVRKQD